MIWFNPTLIAGAVCLALGLFSGIGIARMDGQRKLASLQAQHAIERAQAERQAKQAIDRARAVEQWRVAEVMEVSDAAHAQAAAARTDAERARAAAVELRRAYLAAAGALTRERPADPAAAGASAPAAGPGLVLTELFGRGDATLRECASALDQSRTAGRACERAYDALRVEP